MVFRRFHKRLLETAKDEATFHTIGPVWDRQQTPLAERVFIEWLIYFGCFVTAALIVALKPAFDYGWIPYYPVPLSLKLVLILVGSLGLAVINAGFPRWRWLMILGGCLIVGYSINSIYRSSLEYGRASSWLDSPDHWPAVFGVIFLNIYVAIAVFATLILGGLHYYARWSGKSVRFSLPKKVIVACCLIGALVFGAAPWCYSSLRVPYWFMRGIFIRNDAKEIEFYNEILRLTPESDDYHIRSLCRRAETYTKIKQYDLALADFDAAIQLVEKQPVTSNSQFRLYGSLEKRADVKFLLGDLRGAIADYTVPLDDPEWRGCNSLYHRGYAYEMLGEKDQAIADYTAAIKMLERDIVPAWQKHCKSLVPRPGCDDPARVTLEELKFLITNY